MSKTYPRGAERIQSFGTTVFTVWTQLAQKHQAINLGQGFPDFAPPEFVREAGRQAMEGYQQYSPHKGFPALRNALAQQAERDWGRSVDPEKEITVTVGATEGIYAVIQALIDRDDEVILIEPFYDSYPASILMAGGVPRFVPLRPNATHQWELDLDELRSTITPRTKALILNTPHNPTGKCFTREELLGLAALCIEHDLLVIADEVYDRLLFDDREHVSIATLPGMWERTLTISSAGKTFSVTGWKVGWVIAPEDLTHALQMAQQWIPFCVATPMQAAVAVAIEQSKENNYYNEVRDLYQKKRDFFFQVLQEANLNPYPAEGTYFIVADTSAWGFDNDEAFCHHLTTNVGVVAIPPSYFFSPPNKHIAHKMARFAFCKEDHVLEAAAERLRKA
ncbi:MAG: aminotransferase class I/II-fold pyridoxal phosphate-dependent enzyme [Myxococcales bacterium]|nr:aminotransferase class I/II-fold pyridoxal phosphate-dependent enzyme [Myxococcales bacterium]